MIDFENRKKVFEDVDGRFKFSVILMTGADTPQAEIRCGFFLHGIDDLDDETRVFPLTPEDFKLFNPNTLICPIFRNRNEAELTRKIYANAPILIDTNPDGSGNPWGVSFSAMFHMTNDSGLFRNFKQLEALGAYQDASDAGNVYTAGGDKYWPLYEGKMVQMYDHRAAGITINLNNVHRPAQEEPVTLADHRNPDFAPTPQFWMNAKHVLPFVTNAPPLVIEAYRQGKPETLRHALLFWFLGHYFDLGEDAKGRKRASELFPGDLTTTAWRQNFMGWRGDEAAKAMERRCPLLESDLALFEQSAKENDWSGLALALLEAKRSKWLLAYKDVTAPTNVRTMIASAIPASSVGNTLCLVNLSPLMPKECLLANLSAFALDFAARQKVGGQHLNFFIVEQLPVLPPEKYDESWQGIKVMDFIRPRVLELCYTAHDMKGFAEELGHHGEPFAWDEERRLHLRCQLDALYFHLYGLTREETGAILETFPIVKRQDEAFHHGKFRTRDLILAYYNAYAGGNLKAWVKG